MARLTLVLAVVISLSLSCRSKQDSSAATVEAGWISLFDGKTLEGWRASENQGTFKVIDGAIVAEGARSHLFYAGAVQNADFSSFELKVDVMAGPGANSGVYFHTEYQETDWPKKGLEIQINNTQPEHNGYYEFKKTGSLYGIRNIYKQLMKDNEWFTMHITVNGPSVQVRLNDMLVVDHVEPVHGTQLGRGTFALQGHDPGSKVRFRNIRVRPIPLDEVRRVARPDGEPHARVRELAGGNFPIIDFHAHLKGGLTLEDVLAKQRRTGINYGLAPNCGLNFPITNDGGIDRFIREMKGQPVFLGMQAEGREWLNMFSKRAAAQFDYVFTDAMTFTDDKGRRVRIWIRDELGEIQDPQAWMDMYVDRVVAVMREPIDIYANATFLPDQIAGDYDKLWTTPRMQKVIEAAVKNDVAIEISARYRIPNAAFIKLAKAQGAKFSFGTNNGGKDDLGELEYCLQMIRECGLTAKDMFMPRPDGKKAVQVKPGLR